MSAPDPEKRWDSNSDTSTRNDAEHAELTTDDPLAGVAAQRDLEDGKYGNAEAVEETESQDDIEKEKTGRLEMRRMQSDWTQNTETSYATTERTQTQETLPRKRTLGQKLNPFKSKHLPPVPEERLSSREHSAHFFSRLTFQWISPLMSVGYQRPLETNDVWSVNPDREVDKMSERLKSFLKKRNEAGSKRPLTMALYDTFKKEFIIGGACQLTAALCQVMSPFVMKYLIKFAAEAYIAQITGGPAPHVSHGIGLVIGITCMQVIQSLSTNHFIYRGMMVGGEARAVLISLIFDKAMKISGRARAGGKPKDKDQSQNDEQPPKGIEPGSKEEKAWFKKRLGKQKKKPKGNKDAAANNEGWSNGRIVNLYVFSSFSPKKHHKWRDCTTCAQVHAALPQWR